MARNAQEIRQEAPAAPTAPAQQEAPAAPATTSTPVLADGAIDLAAANAAAAATTANVPYGKRVSFAILGKPFQSKDKKRRYIGLATYVLTGAPAYHASAQISVLTTEAGRRVVEIMFPTGRFGAADPITATTKEAQEAFASFLKREAESASAWIMTLPNRKDLLTAELGAVTSTGADLSLD